MSGIESQKSYAPSGASLDVDLEGIGCLRGWRFVLDLFSEAQNSRVANIVAFEPDDEVWGGLYRLDKELILRNDGQRSVMDRIEGYRRDGGKPPSYCPIAVRVETENQTVDAITYIGPADAQARCQSQNPNATVTRAYAEFILKGAKDLGLPNDYQFDVSKLLRVQISHDQESGETTAGF